MHLKIFVVLLLTIGYITSGQAQANYATAVILALVYSICGFVLGIISRMEKDIFKLFPNLGIVLNLLVMICIAGILYLGLV